MKKFNHENARAALAAQCPEIVAYADQHGVGIERAMDCAYEGRMSNVARQFVSNLPEGWMWEESAASPEQQAHNVFVAGRQAFERAVKEMVGKIGHHTSVWHTDDASGIDMPDGLRAHLEAQEKKLRAELQPLADASPWGEMPSTGQWYWQLQCWHRRNGERI
jgi:hypothetical protein